jgi:hypothetical protein
VSTDGELDDLFAPPPRSPSMDLRYRQGQLAYFDPVTFANGVYVGGTMLTNLPLFVTGDVSLLVAGVSVGIVSIVGASGGVSWVILGRIVQPPV